MRVSVVAQPVKIKTPASVPSASATERMRRCMRDDRTFVMFSQRWLIHHSVPGNVSRMQDHYGHRISYLRVSITDRCNERCSYCMPQELQEWLPREEILTYEETLRLIRIAVELGVSKVRITGGEPLTRRDVVDFARRIPEIPGIKSIGLSTNATLLARKMTPGKTMAAALCQAGVQSVNISLDTLDASVYSEITGRDFHARVLDGIDAAMTAGFDQIKLNTVLMRGRNEDQLLPLIEFAAARKLVLRFIEMMPVSTTEVLNEHNFMSVTEAKRTIESAYGTLISEAEFRTNGPATYYRIPGRAQRIGFIGAMTNLHFCDSCNKLRLTCDGKLRPCLGSYLEFDIMRPLRTGASDEQLKEFFRGVVDRKPREHDFRNNYQPNRKMIAIGG
jgi:cyclic pyranopterin phosphate synthase